MLALLDVLLVVMVLHVDLLLEDVEEEDGRGVLGELEHLQPLVEGAHLQLYLVVFHQGNAHLEEVDLALQHEVVPDPQQELALEAACEDRQEPSHQVHPRLETDAFEVVLDRWAVHLHQVLEQLDSQLDLALVSSVEAEEVVAVDEVYQVHYRVVVLVLVEDGEEYLAEQQQVSDWRKVGPHGYQRLAHLDDVLVHLYILVLRYALLPLLDVLNDHRIDGQVVANDERPQRLPARRRKSMLPERL